MGSSETPKRSDLAKTTPPGTLARAAERTREQTRKILEAATAPATRRAYEGDLRYFWAWAKADLGLSPSFPVEPGVVVKFIANHLEGLEEETDRQLVEAGTKRRPGPHSLATVTRRVASLSSAHQVLDLPNPCASNPVKLLLSSARRQHAREGRGPKKMRAATLDLLEALLATCRADSDEPAQRLRDLRDRAVLLFAWGSGGRRRSEVAAAQLEHLTPVTDGYLFHLGVSKTDQAGTGAELPVFGRAGTALEAWLTEAGLTAERGGQIFRAIDRHGNVRDKLTAQSVGAIVRRRARLAGFEARRFCGHSLRSGFMTEAGRQGVQLADAMQLARLKTVQVALGYQQAGSVIHNPAARLADRGATAQVVA